MSQSREGVRPATAVGGSSLREDNVNFNLDLTEECEMQVSSLDSRIRWFLEMPDEVELLNVDILTHVQGSPMVEHWSSI